MCRRFFKKRQQSDPSKEEYWNSKYPKANIAYEGRFLPNVGQVSVDVRDFFVNSNDVQLQEIVSSFAVKSDDEKALECLRWAINNLQYVDDKTEFGLEEFWCFPFEVLKTKKGDCDDGAILVANLMLAAGVSYWKVRLTAGLVPEGGHAYITYFVEKLDYWVALDWSYYPNLDAVDKRPDYKQSPIYREVWFSWNSRYAFATGVKSIANSNSNERALLKKVKFL